VNVALFDDAGWLCWVLTDLRAGQLHLADWEIHSHQFPEVAPGNPWSLRQRTLAAGRSAGVCLLEIEAGAWRLGLVPTRGMGIWRGFWRGLPLGWQAPVLGPVNPAFVDLHDRDGLGWLDGFDEWIVRCGLASNGPPGIDPQTGQRLTLHGRIANQPAHYVEVRIQRHAPYAIQVIGKVQETTLFFSDFLLTSKITLWPGSAELLIEDEVTNLRSQSTPMQLLYHCNFGPPLAAAGSTVRVAYRSMQPRDAAAAAGLSTWSTLDEPTPGYAEQVFLFVAEADAAGQGQAWLHTARQDLGLHLSWSAATLPYFNLWKNCVPISDGYVLGLEPATGYPYFHDVERQAGRLVSLGAGQTWSGHVRLRILEGEAARAAALQGP
jgi:galactose mutarotase-like enzyme